MKEFVASLLFATLLLTNPYEIIDRVPVADQEANATTLTEVDGVRIISWKRTGQPLVTTQLTADCAGAAVYAPPALSVDPAQRNHTWTHDFHTDGHTTTVTPRIGGMCYRSYTKTAAAQEAKAEIEVRGRIRITTQNPDDVVVIWDGYANPYRETLESAAGNPKLTDSSTT